MASAFRTVIDILYYIISKVEEERVFFSTRNVKVSAS